MKPLIASPIHQEGAILFETHVRNGSPAALVAKCGRNRSTPESRRPGRWPRIPSRAKWKCMVRTAKCYFVIVNGFAISRAVSMKRPASGLSVRSFKVTMRTGATGLGNSTGNTLRGRRPR